MPFKATQLHRIYKKTTTSLAGKMAGSNYQQETHGCALTGNALMFTYVQVFDCLHMACPV